MPLFKYRSMSDVKAMQALALSKRRSYLEPVDDTNLRHFVGWSEVRARANQEVSLIQPLNKVEGFSELSPGIHYSVTSKGLEESQSIAAGTPRIPLGVAEDEKSLICSIQPLADK